MFNKNPSNEEEFSIVFVADTSKYKYKLMATLLMTSILLNTNVRDIHVIIPKEANASLSDIPEILRKYGKLHVVSNPIGMGWGWRIEGIGIRTKYSKRLVVDTDAIILKNISLKFLDNYSFGVVPMHKVESHKFFSKELLEKYYSHFNLKKPMITVRTQRGELLEYPIFDPGFIAIRDSYDFKNIWIDTIVELTSQFHIGLYADMIALPITLMRYLGNDERFEKYVKILDSTWCYHPRTGRYFIPKDVKVLHFASHRVIDYFLLKNSVPSLAKISKILGLPSHNIYMKLLLEKHGICKSVLYAMIHLLELLEIKVCNYLVIDLEEIIWNIMNFIFTR